MLLCRREVAHVRDLGNAFVNHCHILMGLHTILIFTVSRNLSMKVVSRCVGLKVCPVPFLDDNYSYLVVDLSTGCGVAIDPADPEAVKVFQKYL